MTDPRSHWDHTYTVKPDTEVSWYQPVPDRSLSLIKSAAPNPSASIIDVGGGASRLVDRLLADGYSDLTVLDIPTSRSAVQGNDWEHSPTRFPG
jgi:hypothetical protein